jgi:hypothetical protein
MQAGGLDVVPVAAFVEPPQLPQGTLYNALTTRASNSSAAVSQCISEQEPESEAWEGVLGGRGGGNEASMFMLKWGCVVAR